MTLPPYEPDALSPTCPCKRCGVTVAREDECQVYNKVTGLAERPYCRACHDLRRFELADPAFICGHVEVYLNHAGETVGPYRCTLPERHEQPHSDGKVGWYTTAGAAQSAAPLSADNAQPERDPHRDGCVHDPAWACEDCLAARSAAPQPADNAHTGGAS